MKYLLDKIEDNDMLIQNDGSNDDDTSNLCSGFMFIQSNPRTLKIFNPEEMDIHKNTVGWDDQVYINNIKNNLKFKTLPFDLFPTGAYYYKNHSSINPYMIHFNWVVGHEKERRMRCYNKWLI